MGASVLMTELQFQQYRDLASLGPALKPTTGNVYFVHATKGASTNGGTHSRDALTTLALALAKCNSSQGDTVILMEGHAETLSTTTQGVAVSLSGVSIIGLGNGRNRPALTCGAATVSGVVISGNNNLFKNIRVIGSTSQTTATNVLVSLTGDDNILEDCSFEHGGAGPLSAVGVSGGDRCTIRGCTFLGTADGPDMGLKFFTTSTHATVEDCVFNYATVTCDSAIIGCLANSAPTQSLFRDLVCLGATSTGIRFVGSASSTRSDSLMCRIYGTTAAAVTGAAMIDQGGCAVADIYWANCIALASMYLGTSIKTAVVSNLGKAWNGATPV